MQHLLFNVFGSQFDNLFGIHWFMCACDWCVWSSNIRLLKTCSSEGTLTLKSTWLWRWAKIILGYLASQTFTFTMLCAHSTSVVWKVRNSHHEIIWTRWILHWAMNGIVWASECLCLWLFSVSSFSLWLSVSPSYCGNEWVGAEDENVWVIKSCAINETIYLCRFVPFSNSSTLAVYLGWSLWAT